MDINTINRIVMSSFVFISYARENYAVASLIYDYLYKHGINVLFDGGGLPRGMSLPEFEQYIIHSNCKKVLMIFDSNYSAKIISHTGEVWQEYDLIRNHYRSYNKDKYIPVLCDGFNKDNLPPLFKGQTIFGTVTDLDGLVNDCNAASNHKPHLMSPAKAKKLMNTADNLYDSCDYLLCLKYSTELLDSQVNAHVLAQACSTVLCMYLTDNIEYSDVVEKAFNKLLGLLKKASLKKDTKNYPRYLLNCSLMFQKCEWFNPSYKHNSLDYAKCALDKAIEFNYSNVYYYECHCARILEASGALNNANKHMCNARHILVNDYGGHNKRDNLTSWEVYLYGAKIMIGLADQCIDKKNDATLSNNYLDEAYDQLVYLVNNLDALDISPADERELYETLSVYYHIRKKSVA